MTPFSKLFKGSSSYHSYSSKPFHDLTHPATFVLLPPDVMNGLKPSLTSSAQLLCRCLCHKNILHSSFSLCLLLIQDFAQVFSFLVKRWLLQNETNTPSLGSSKYLILKFFTNHNCLKFLLFWGGGEEVYILLYIFSILSFIKLFVTTL